MSILVSSLPLLLCVLLLCPYHIEAFTFRLARSSHLSNRLSCRQKRFTASKLSQDSNQDSTNSSHFNSSVDDTRNGLKMKVYALCAACDRGFGATSTDRQEIDELVMKLASLCPIPIPSEGLVPNLQQNNVSSRVPLEGAWRMVYTSAFDVLSIAASPFTLLQSIYQVIDRSGKSVNIIDIAPRFQPLLPLNMVKEGSTLRLRVFTKVYARTPTRIGLAFKSAEAKPLSLAGFDVTSILPPLSTDLFSPLQSFGISGADGEKGPGFFDILYLDDDMLIIRQNDPGGIFISTRSNEYYPDLLK